MRRLLRRLTVFVGVLGVVMALNVGVAFAHSTGAEHAFTANGLDNSAPVGSNALGIDPQPDPHPGQFKGFFNSSNAVNAIANNPLCPAHHAQHVD